MFVKKIKSFIRFPKSIFRNIIFAIGNQNLRDTQKIIYALTPPPYLSNVGDHAQVIAISAWLKKHFQGFPIIELDKDQGHLYLPTLKWLVNSKDIIFLHSGGNLGDRGKWSENRRREIIKNFPNNQIISLPQTIFFSDTDNGKAEREISSHIYNAHSNLTIIGRDPRSGELAAELFPKAKSFCMPDFVLSLPHKKSEKNNINKKVLLCLRLDNESALTPKEREKISLDLAYECTYYDTTIDQDIPTNCREEVLNDTLARFLDADIVVTDRYHGLIFTVLCQKPCIVLQTVDHKLTSAIYWFQDIPSIFFAKRIENIPELVEKCLSLEKHDNVDWNKNYFDKIPSLIGF